MGLACVIFRLAFADSPFLEECRDHSGDTTPSKCVPELLTAIEHTEVYFGNLGTAVFTVFRCITWDCSTEEGASLTVILSRGYGLPFNVGYVILSVFMVCGILNVIMATFVQKTTDQLDERETFFVQSRLRDLVTRVLRHARSGGLWSSKSGTSTVHTAFGEFRWPIRGEIVFSLHQFCKMFDDDWQIRSVMHDLGLKVGAVELFHIVDTTQDGTVDVVELLDALLMISVIKKPGTMTVLVAMRDLSDRMNLMDDSAMKPPSPP